MAESSDLEDLDTIISGLQTRLLDIPESETNKKCLAQAKTALAELKKADDAMREATSAQ